MTSRLALLSLTVIALAGAQSGSKMIATNLDTAAFQHDKGDPPGSESVFLRQDAKTGGMDLLVRFPSGHVFAPHWHESNERIIVAEGQLTVTQDSGPVQVNAGGYVFLPAREVQRLWCTSSSRCTFYLSWDGDPKSHAAK